nr:uncharacterized protein LOC116770590 isoform X2 [Danaus plexippus plexippus]XP_032518020.1 uncharacterized protein LOC116770590 isoform X2 [Danaus plexippus plexippus]
MEPRGPSLSGGERLTNKEIGMLRKICLNSRCDLPDPDRCCCCLPLRPGLLTLAYIKLGISVLLLLIIIYFILIIYLVFTLHTDVTHVLIWIALCLDFVDIVIGIFIIVSAHKKSIKFMEIYYKTSIFVFLMLSFLCAVIFHVIADHVYSLLILLTVFFLILLLQIYIVLLVRSEVLKLRSNAQFQFLNNETEPECVYINGGST